MFGLKSMVESLDQSYKTSQTVCVLFKEKFAEKLTVLWIVNNEV